MPCHNPQIWRFAFVQPFFFFFEFSKHSIDGASLSVAWWWWNLFTTRICIPNFPFLITLKRNERSFFGFELNKRTMQLGVCFECLRDLGWVPTRARVAPQNANAFFCFGRERGQDWIGFLVYGFVTNNLTGTSSFRLAGNGIYWLDCPKLEFVYQFEEIS